jgi:hypothetical protein
MSMKRIIQIASPLWGAILGRIAAWIVWQMIYGVGNRVIDDQTAYELEAPVVLAGTMVGGLLGLVTAVFSRWPLLAQLGIHLTAGLAFTICTLIDALMVTWKVCLIEYGFLLVASTAIHTWILRNDWVNNTAEGICQPADGLPRPSV